MNRSTALLSAALLSWGVLTMAPGVMAATAAPAASQVTTAAAVKTTAAKFTDQQLQDFASAAVKISEITQTYMPQLQKAGSNAQQKDAILSQANGKMVKAVESSGLKVEEFNRIGQAIQQDPQLLKRVQAMAQPRS